MNRAPATETKKTRIIEAAAQLFAVKRFDEVKLDEIAATAKLGKGTVYLYFESKEDLYAELILHGLKSLLQELGNISPTRKAGGDAWSDLGRIVDALLDFARRNPHLDALMRANAGMNDLRIQKKRAEMVAVCEGVLRRGVQRGTFADPHPELTAQYLLSFVRTAILYVPKSVKKSTLRAHILRVLGGGIQRGQGRAVRA